MMRKKLFKDLDIQEQKMKIVQDAIDQIKSKKIVPKKGCYFELLKQETDFDYIATVYLDKEESLKEKMLEPLNYCECCAKGAIFASCVSNVNKVKGIHNFGDEGFMKSKLKKWFKPLELDMIEAAFEGDIIEDSTGKLNKGRTVTELGSKCKKFSNKYKNSNTRLFGILKNILKHGEFKP